MDRPMPRALINASLRVHRLKNRCSLWWPRFRHLGLFVVAESAGYQVMEAGMEEAFFYIYADTALRCECDQPMRAAVAHVEADRGG